MARLQDYQTVTPSGSDKLLIVQSQGQGLSTLDSVVGVKMDKANPTGTGSLSLNRKSGTTTGVRSTTEGYNGTASGTNSHAEGYQTTASGSESHAENESTTASGNGSHAEGKSTTASGKYAHAENNTTTASGSESHAEGFNTIANHSSQHVFGQYNIADPSTAAATSRGTYVEIVGKGSEDNARSNARTLDWSGNEVLAGDLTIMGNKSVNSAITVTEYTFTGTTSATGSLNTNIDFTSSIRVAYVISGSYARACLLRPSPSNKIIAICLNDDLTPIAEASVTLHVFA